jgi:hypothetical protein
MNTQSRASNTTRDDARLQRAIVLQLLRDDRPRRWTQADLAAELAAERSLVEAALQALHGDGVLIQGDDGEVWASRAALRLDELKLVAI